MQNSSTGMSRTGRAIVSDGDLTMEVMIRLPPRICCIQRDDELAWKSDS